jgi:hypothetical protein
MTPIDKGRTAAAGHDKSQGGDRQPHDPTSDPAGAVSNQNGEEAESGLREDATHPEPRTEDRPTEASP